MSQYNYVGPGLGGRGGPQGWGERSLRSDLPPACLQTQEAPEEMTSEHKEQEFPREAGRRGTSVSRDTS